MCAAIEEMKMDSKLEGRLEGKLEGRLEGKIEGAVETYREFGVLFPDAIQRVADKFNLSLQKSEEKVRKYWE